MRWGGSKPGRRMKVTDDQLKVITRIYTEEEKIAAIARATGLSRQTGYQYLSAKAGCVRQTVTSQAPRARRLGIAW